MPIDMHIHSNFSPDGSVSIQALAAKAASLFASIIAITDHCDPLYFDSRYEGITDFEPYFAALNSARQAIDLTILAGVEMGFHPNAQGIIQDFLARFDFDYVINSVHQVDGMECYYPSFFDNKSREEGYVRYFETVLASLDADYHYDAIGHLGYVCRNAPFENRELITAKTEPLIDKILTKIIEKGKIIELNTSVRSAPYPFLPSPQILQQYFDMGGRLITFASDAHDTKRLLHDYQKTAELARQIGFEYWSVPICGKLTKINF